MARKVSKAVRRPVSWSLRHGPVVGAYNAAAWLGALTGANAAWDIGLDPRWAAGLAAAGAVATHVDARARKLGKAAKVYRAGCWAAAGAWTWHALETTPWDAETLMAGVGLAGIAAVLAPALAGHERTARERRREEEAEQERWDLAQQWAARIQRVCKIRSAVQVRGIEKWMFPDPAHPGVVRETGYTVEVVLPKGGYSWETLAKKKRDLGNDLDLPQGCSLDVLPGVSRRRALIDVTTVNVLAGDIALAEPERLPASIEDPLVVGLYSNGAPVEIPLRWTPALLVGAKRQGKSNMIKNITRQLLRCDDVVVFGIDPNGGEVFKPFLRPWLEGKVSRPAIDWVATDEEEALRMLRFLRGAIPRRRSGYSEHMWTSGGDDKLAVSPQIPQIVLITDESKSLSPQVKSLLVEVNDRGGAASIVPVTSWLRAVANGRDGLPRDLLVQSETRISVRVNDDAELKRLFGWSSRVPPAGEAPAPGWGHAVAYNDGVPRLYKGARSTNYDAYEEAGRTASWRPGLDEITIGDGADRQVYEQRWERALSSGWLQVGSLPGIKTPTTDSRSHVAPERPERPWRSREERRARIEERRARWRARQEGELPESAPHLGGDVDERFAQIVAGFQRDVEEAGDGAVPDFLAAVLAVFDEYDAGAVHRSVLAERLCGGDRARLSRLLDAVGVAPRQGTFRMSGSGRGSERGYERAAVEAAVERIREGERVPDEVAAWRPEA